MTDHKSALDKVLLDRPNVTEGKAFGYPAYKANGKVFAFLGDKGVGLKLSEARAQALIAENEEMHPFEAKTGTVWKAWVSIDPANADYERYNKLFDESIELVSR